MMTDSEKIEFFGGQIHALMGFALAVITEHSAVANLSRHLNFVSDVTLAQAENSLVSDRYIEGIQDVQRRLLRGVETALAQRANPNSGK
jgi:hypothetical protein